jgi:hypothetical protein
MFTSIRKGRAVNSFVRNVGPSLKRRYGRKRHYSPEEVRRAGRDVGAPTDYFCYAYSIYCSREDFDHHHQETGEHCNYDSMRAEVAETHFGGDTAFDAETAIEAGSSHHDSGGNWLGGGDSHSDSGSLGDSDVGDCGGGDGGGGD